MFIPKLIGKAANLITKFQGNPTAKRAIAAFKKPAPPKPAPKKPAPKPALKPVPPRPVAVVLPPAPRPVVLPAKKADTVSVFGVDVPKPVAYIGGTALGVAAVVGIARAVR